MLTFKQFIVEANKLKEEEEKPKSTFRKTYEFLTKERRKRDIPGALWKGGGAVLKGLRTGINVTAGGAAAGTAAGLAAAGKGLHNVVKAAAPHAGKAARGILSYIKGIRNRNKSPQASTPAPQTNTPAPQTNTPAPQTNTNATSKGAGKGRARKATAGTRKTRSLLNRAKARKATAGKGKGRARKATAGKGTAGKGNKTPESNNSAVKKGTPAVLGPRTSPRNQVNARNKAKRETP